MEKAYLAKSINEKIIETLRHAGVPEIITEQIDTIIYFTVILIVAYLSGKLSHLLTTKIIQRIQKHKEYTLLSKLMESNTIKRISAIIPPLVILSFLSLTFTDKSRIINAVENITWIYFTTTTIRSLTALFSSIGDAAYSNKKYHDKPIKGFIQTTKIITYIIGTIIIISILTNKSPFYLIGGLGAFAAVLMLIFKDSIMGFVSGILLLENDMIHLGDWIEMPGSAINGIVTDISLTVVKVKNYDNTIVTIPPYSLISNSFINWRAMSESGGRRIMRGYTIKSDNIKICTPEFLEKIRHFTPEMRRFIDSMNYSGKEILSEEERKYGTTETNLGLFRAYLTYYLKSHPSLQKNMLTMVRTLPPTEYGVPLQIYCFSNDTNWSHYESIQSEIMEHLAVTMPVFELLPYQSSSSHDSMINGLVERGFEIEKINGIPVGSLPK